MSAMALTSIFRQVHRLLRSPLSAVSLGDKLRHSVRIIHGSPVRYEQNRILDFFRISQKKSSVLKERDRIPKDFTLIYKAPMENYIKYGYLVALITVLTTPTIVLYNYYINGEILFRREVNEIVFLDPEKEIWIYSAAMVFVTCVVFSVLFKYPVRVYKRDDVQEYIAMFLSATPLKVRQYRYTTAIHRKFKNPLYFFMEDCHFFFDGKKKALLIPHYFRTPSDLCEMCGID